MEPHITNYPKKTLSVWSLLSNHVINVLSSHKWLILFCYFFSAFLSHSFFKVMPVHVFHANTISFQKHNSPGVTIALPEAEVRTRKPTKSFWGPSHGKSGPDWSIFPPLCNSHAPLCLSWTQWMSRLTWSSRQSNLWFQMWTWQQAHVDSKKMFYI